MFAARHPRGSAHTYTGYYLGQLVSRCRAQEDKGSTSRIDLVRCKEQGVFIFFSCFLNADGEFSFYLLSFLRPFPFGVQGEGVGSAIALFFSPFSLCFLIFRSCLLASLVVTWLGLVCRALCCLLMALCICSNMTLWVCEWMKMM